MTFIRDLKIGHKYELEALKYLDYDTYIQADVTKCIKEYDLVITKDKISTKIEIKADFRAKTTGNIAIEYSCNKKKSGIATTEAEYWIIFIIYDSENVCYKIPIKDLKMLCKNNCLRASGGDGCRSRLFLIPIYKCKKYIINKKTIL